VERERERGDHKGSNEAIVPMDFSNKGGLPITSELNRPSSSAPLLLHCVCVCVCAYAIFTLNGGETEMVALCQ